MSASFFGKFSIKTVDRWRRHQSFHIEKKTKHLLIPEISESVLVTLRPTLAGVTMISSPNRFKVSRGKLMKLLLFCCANDNTFAEKSFELWEQLWKINLAPEILHQIITDIIFSVLPLSFTDSFEQICREGKSLLKLPPPPQPLKQYTLKRDESSTFPSS